MAPGGCEFLRTWDAHPNFVRKCALHVGGIDGRDYIVISGPTFYCAIGIADGGVEHRVDLGIRAARPAAAIDVVTDHDIVTRVPGKVGAVRTDGDSDAGQGDSRG